MNKIGTIFEGLEVGKGTTHDNLTVFPLLARTEGELDYLTLSQALEQGLASVSEVSKGGSVPELRFTNSAELPVLITDGEELVGAKQNRVANLTILAPPKTILTIPVSCVEAGRWRFERDDFVASERAHFARGRATRVATVSSAMESAGSRASDQGRVWADISAKAERLRAPSPTQAMAAIYDRHHATVESYVTAFEAIEGQAGAVFAIDEAIVGLDLFDRSATLSAMLGKLIRSYAVDAIETAHREPPAPKRDLALDFLDRVANANLEPYPALGLGTDVRLSAPGVVGGGLLVDDHLVHLAAFAQQQPTTEGPGRDRGMAAMRSRRGSFERR